MVQGNRATECNQEGIKVNMKELRVLLSSEPMTKSVKLALDAGIGVSRIHAAASGMGYTRRAVNYALRANGIKQRKGRIGRSAVSMIATGKRRADVGGGE